MVAKTDRHVGQKQTGGSSATPSARRGLMAGLGVAGVAAVAARLLPGADPVAPAAAPAQSAAAGNTDGGYRLSAHVKRYYETTQS